MKYEKSGKVISSVILGTAVLAAAYETGVFAKNLKHDENVKQKHDGNHGELEAVRLIGASKDGNTNAVNGGEAAHIYNPETYRTLGTIGTEKAFEIVCFDTKPNSFTVKTEQTEGKVNLTNNLVEELFPAELSEIPSCQ